jgi:hypothetical protein
MIIIALKGGLGNQMFQYACGRALSLHDNEPVKLDISGYAKTRTSDTPREYSLSHFSIKEKTIATNEEIRALKYPYGIVSKGWRFIRTKIFRQFNLDWNPRIFSKKGPRYLDGYWQTEKYFVDYADDIRREFSLEKPFGTAAQAIADTISTGQPAVSLHVRRGDVARDAATNRYSGITTPEYYARALAFLAEKLSTLGIKNFHVFVFSDDIEWVKQNIPIPLPTTYVSEKLEIGVPKIPDYEELVLMSMCDHNIIANSSFSWWAAWLNRNHDKIIIAPKIWIRGNGTKHKDIAPASWIRI